MNRVAFDRMVMDAKNEIGELVFIRLGGTAGDGVRSAREIERIIREKVGPLNKLVESAITEYERVDD